MLTVGGIVVLWPLHVLAQAAAPSADWDRAKAVVAAVEFARPIAIACGLNVTPTNEVFANYLKGLDLSAQQRKDLGDLVARWGADGLATLHQMNDVPDVDTCERVKNTMINALKAMMPK